jgi:hypothetical protein
MKKVKQNWWYIDYQKFSSEDATPVYGYYNITQEEDSRIFKSSFTDEGPFSRKEDVKKTIGFNYK